MNTFQTISAKELNENPFQLIGDQWMLITAEKDGKVNTMTASWGGLGILWNRSVAFAFIRQSRYTKELIDGADHFSLSFLDHKKYAKELGYLGTVSGREEEKIKKAGMTVNHEDGVAFIDEASKVMICQKLFVTTMKPAEFVIPEIDTKFYSDKDYHDLYIGGITKILER